MKPKHGKVQGDVWIKEVQGSIHMLRQPPAWCVDHKDLLSAWRCGVKKLRIHDTESGQIYSIPLSQALEGKVIDRGHGQQVLLPLQWFHREASFSEAPGTQEEHS
jgi:hypothetical protein